ncbi:hypothetical protein ACET3Z_010200 [Daucus carota]
MSDNSKTASISMKKSRTEKSFICRVVEGPNNNGVLKIPSAFAAVFCELNLNVIGLHLPLKNAWIARYVSSSETIEGIESLMEYYDVNPWYSFIVKYIGGTEFEVEIFSEYAVEVDYSRKGSSSVLRKPCFNLTDLEKEKIMANYFYSTASTFDPDLEIVITENHVGRRSWTEVFSREEAEEMGLDEEMDWVEFGFEKTVWRIHLKWKKKKLLFHSEWHDLVEDCKLAIGDKCLAVSTFAYQRFSLAVYHQNQATNCYQKGSVEGKGSLKWFKTGKLIFGLKDLLKKYEVEENNTMFFDYIGDSTFYASIYDSHGLEIFNDLTSKLALMSVLNYMAADVYVISDSDDNEEQIIQANADPENYEGQYNFTVELLKSHVDKNYHGVFLPRDLLGLYKNWKKRTIVTLIMNSRAYRLAILRRQKTCRLGVGWNEFVLGNALEEGQKLLFTYTGNATFAVTKIV